jgi:hypothetical protein
MKTSSTEYRTQKLIHTTITILFLTKGPKLYIEGKTASSTDLAGNSGYPSARN